MMIKKANVVKKLNKVNKVKKLNKKKKKKRSLLMMESNMIYKMLIKVIMKKKKFHLNLKLKICNNK